MKRYFFILFINLVAINLTAQEASDLPHELADIETVSKNRVYPRTVFMTYSRVDDAMENDYENSEFYQSLNRKWKFRYLKSASLLDPEYVSEDYDDSLWDDILVPGNWEMQGFQNATYADSTYDFKFNKKDMSITGHTAVGVYRTKFKIPYIWEERQIFLHIGAVKSGSRVYINGQEAGYCEDSKTPSQFDITLLVKEGYNTIAIETFNHSSGSFLESNADWKLSGIERSTYIYTQPKVCIRDFTIRTGLNPEKSDALLELGVITKSHYLNQKNVKIYYELTAPDGETVSYESRSARLRMRLEDTVYFAIPVHNVKLWSAEKPDLYTLVMRVQREGRFTEAVKWEVGFRDIAFSGDRLLVNGKAIELKGVVYAEHNSATGHIVSQEQMESDILTMKNLGINAIRTEHPMPHYFYELCDKIGMYVVDMANISSKPMGKSLNRGGSLANNSIFRDSHIERVVAAHQNSRNYCSVIMLSMGMNGGNGYNFYKAYQRVKELEVLRPVGYEGAGKEWNSDIFCPANPSLKEISAWSREQNDRPYIFSSIAIDSNMSHKWDIILSSDNLQGGFIDGWQDKALPTEGGKWVSGSQSKQSLITPDGEFTASAEGIKEMFETFKITLDRDSSELTIDNRSDFVELKDCTIECRVSSTEKELITLPYTIDIEPRSKGGVNITEALINKDSHLLEVTIVDNYSKRTIHQIDINL